MNFLQLPECVIMQILEYLSFDEVAKKRSVCRTLDRIGQDILNRGFSKCMHVHSTEFRKIKLLLPRRESERRNHPLSRVIDILRSMETRITLLSMTYEKFIEMGICCFIPGKVLDEIFTLLRYVQGTDLNTNIRNHEILQEFRDVSLMATDHFDEVIAPILKKRLPELNSRKDRILFEAFPAATIHPLQKPVTKIVCINTLKPIKKERYTKDDSAVEELINRRLIGLNGRYSVVINKVKRMLTLQDRQMRLNRENTTRIKALSSKVVKISRRLQETETKNRVLSEMLAAHMANESPKIDA